MVQGIVEPDECVVFTPLLEQKGLAPILEKTLGAKEKKIVYGEWSNRDLAHPVLNAPLF